MERLIIGALAMCEATTVAGMPPPGAANSTYADGGCSGARGPPARTPELLGSSGLVPPAVAASGCRGQSTGAGGDSLGVANARALTNL